MNEDDTFSALDRIPFDQMVNLYVSRVRSESTLNEDYTRDKLYNAVKQNYSIAKGWPYLELMSDYTINLLSEYYWDAGEFFTRIVTDD